MQSREATVAPRGDVTANIYLTGRLEEQLETKLNYIKIKDRTDSLQGLVQQSRL